VARARTGERVALTGRSGLLAGLIGRVLQAGLALEQEDDLGGGGGNGRNGYRTGSIVSRALATST
jgi:hypothetical protein